MLSHLAGVLATGIKTSADHGVSDVILSIGVTAVIVRDNGHIDLDNELRVMKPNPPFV